MVEGVVEFGGIIVRRIQRFHVETLWLLRSIERDELLTRMVDYGLSVFV